MTTERSLDSLIEEFNQKAKAEGRYDPRTFFDMPRSSSGSILDVPMTPEVEERIRGLRELLARLEQQKAAASAKPSAAQAPDRSAPPVVSDSAGGPLVTNVPS